MKKELLTLLALITISYSSAEVTLPPLFSDNMILQQQTLAPIWGTTSKKGATLKIKTSWNNQTTTCNSDSDGNWKAVLETPSYGGPYTITINDGDIKEVNNVLIGEVWIASGQSNMEMEMSGFNGQHVEYSNIDIACSTDNQLRIMDVERAVSATPLSTITSAGWGEACPEVVAPLSATAYHFARILRASLKIPVGILVSTWGGTSINSWVCPEDANSYQDVKDRTRKSSPRSQHYPGGLYNGMICPIAGYAAKGFIWYQGESDRMRYDTYGKKLQDMATKWRKDWDNEQMPFYFAQIAPFEYAGKDKADTLAPYMREAMVEAVNIIPNSDVIILSDAGLRNCIHPSNKRAVGERFAYKALVKTYNTKGIVADAPTYKSKETKDNTIILTFDNADTGLTSFGSPLTDFEVAGADGKYYPATAKTRGNTIILSSKEVANPINARYGFKNWFQGSLFNIGGIPASSFRTDKPKFNL
ncbi:MAG: sialate O-acetylesterase [Rikenellaceae bacterium]